MVPILLNICGIYHKQVSDIVKLIDKKVIHNSTLSVREAGVLHLARIEHGCVVGGHILYKSKSIGTLYPNLAHMRNIKNAHIVAHCGVLLIYAAILYRHIKPCKGSHLCTKFNVFLMKYCLFHIYLLLIFILKIFKTQI